MQVACHCVPPTTVPLLEKKYLTGSIPCVPPTTVPLLEKKYLTGSLPLCTPNHSAFVGEEIFNRGHTMCTPNHSAFVGEEIFNRELTYVYPQPQCLCWQSRGLNLDHNFYEMWREYLPWGAGSLHPEHPFGAPLQAIYKSCRGRPTVCRSSRWCLG